MTPVDQTKFGFPHGNCFSACVASILDLTLDECDIYPDGVDQESEKCLRRNRHWWPVFQEWLREQGHEPVYLLKNEVKRAPKGLSIISGPGPRGLDHSTVGLDGEIVHDPHPSREGLKEVSDYIVFVPLI